MPTKSDSTEKSDKIKETLIQNLIELQKVHTNLLEKFDKLSNQLSTLLNLFESAAKSFSDNASNKVSERDKEFADKIDQLLEQNKIIAKGVMLMEDRLRQKAYDNQQPINQNNIRLRENNENYQSSDFSKPLPRF